MLAWLRGREKITCFYLQTHNTTQRRCLSFLIYFFCEHSKDFIQDLYYIYLFIEKCKVLIVKRAQNQLNILKRYFESDFKLLFKLSFF